MFLFQPKEQRRNTQKLSVWSKLCYAFGGAPYQITGSALGFFLQIYLLDVAQVIKICFLKKGKLNKISKEAAEYLQAVINDSFQ